ncbi:MAG TPA: hypothetical protein VGC46_03220 [Allosphingosinicella sp.]
MRSSPLSPASGAGLRLLVVVLVALAGIVVIDSLPQPAPRPPPPASPPIGPARSYDQLLASRDSALAERRRLAEERPDEWLVQEQFARAALARARLTGSYDDYAAAQQALDQAFAQAPSGAGPHLSQAVLHLTLHRLGPAEQMLDSIARYAVPPDAGERAEIAAMRGDIAFYRGDYPRALRLYDEADTLEPGTAHFRRAIFHSKTGRVDLAERYFALYERTLAAVDRHGRANVELQRGILDLDNGRHREALAHFRVAEALFPGWWLVDEHVAETTALLGDAADAERRYRDIVRRTGSPEFIDALGALLRARGADDEAETLRRQSAALWERRLGQFPEATYGHAIDHCFAFARPGCALALARRNFAARPYGEAGEKLARALAGVGRPAEARVVIERVLASGWRTREAERIARMVGPA